MTVESCLALYRAVHGTKLGTPRIEGTLLKEMIKMLKVLKVFKMLKVFKREENDYLPLSSEQERGARLNTP